MSSYIATINNIIKAAQVNALDEVLATLCASGSFDEAQLAPFFDAYKAQALTPDAAPKKGKKGAAPVADKPKRKFTPNGYSVFSRENRPAILAANPDVAPKDVMGLIGEAWKALTEDEQNVYKAKAKDMPQLDDAVDALAASVESLSVGDAKAEKKVKEPKVKAEKTEKEPKVKTEKKVKAEKADE